MLIADLFENDFPGFRTEKDDNSVRKLSDVRKTRLTLAHIKRLRIMSDVRKFEKQKKVQNISKQYKPPAAVAAASGF